MKTTLKTIFPLIIAIILNSCGESENDNYKVKLTGIIEKNKSAVNELEIKYKTNSSWDTTQHFSSDYQNIFINENKLMLFKGRVYDIVYSDSVYLVKLLTIDDNIHRQFIAVIKATAEQVNKINRSIKKNVSQLELIGKFGKEEYIKRIYKNNILKHYQKNVFVNGAFVIKVKNVISTNPTLNKVIDEDSNEFIYWSIDEKHFIQIFKGELIDFCIAENDILDK